MTSANVPQDDLKAEIKSRLKIIPNFFCIGGENSLISEHLWSEAKASYLENPLPALFKERFFHLRFSILFGALLYCSTCRISGGIE